jgi:exosortase
MALIADSVVSDNPPRLSESATARSRQPSAGIAAVGIGLVVLYAPTLWWLFERWTLSVWQHAHGLFIPPMVAWLVWRELQRRPELRADAGTAWGFVLLLPALFIHALDAGMHTQLLSAVSILIALPGLSLLFLGTRRTTAIIFPLVFCAFALPIPLALTEPAHQVLRHIAAAGTATVLPYLGFPVFLEGTSLHLTNTTLQIVDACSGFSTLYAALAVACLTAYSTSSRWRRVLVLTAAAPLAIMANVLRIVGLAILIVWRGPDVLQTFLHPLSGMLTFVIALPLIFWLGGPALEEPAA